jgi:magnesium transporter
MNVAGEGMPFADSPWGFLAIILISLAISIVVAYYLAKRKMF